jgi:putative flippase GtrA
MRRSDAVRPIRYAIVGVGNTILYCLLLWLLLSTTSLRHGVAVTLAFCLAMLFQYFANKAFTFRSRRRIGPEFVRYLIVALINYVLNILLVWVLLDVLAASRLVTVAVMGIVSGGCGYALSLLWVYRGGVDTGARMEGRQPRARAEEGQRT